MNIHTGGILVLDGVSLTALHLGSLANGLDWLRWGWHPYYGPLPDGFVATDYVPTPWIYFPAYGLWRQPGIMGWAPSGPPFNYSGPISVEVSNHVTLV